MLYVADEAKLFLSSDHVQAGTASVGVLDRIDNLVTGIILYMTFLLKHKLL